MNARSLETAAAWEWANNTPVGKPTIYFLICYVGDQMVYRNNRHGHLITYRTREQAIRMVEKLNAVTEEVRP